MELMNITLFLFLINQISTFPTQDSSSEEIADLPEISSEVIGYIGNSNSIEDDLSISFQNDDLSVENFSVDDVECDDESPKKSAISKREVPKDGERGKRALIFRPLFVYKQQEVKRQKVQEQRRTSTTRKTRTRAPTYGGGRPIE